MFGTGSAITRLNKELQKYGKLFIAFDFDSTIFDYHNEGLNCSDVITLLKQCSDKGHTLILFTATSSKERLTFMQLYCKHFGIKVSYINENPEVPGATTKPYYNILLDDRAGLSESYKVLDTVINPETTHVK